ncbi:YceD family protein [Ferrovum sp.]|uniref:YceD family protein n=1 Tax=Ferrovum sp. TaxID=2609467 RepID=UPI0026305AB0|nr:YceD family protein [Ferrovum sp.]
MFDAPILDPQRFTALAERVEGECRPDQIPALQEYLFSPEGKIRFVMRGWVDERRRRLLEVQIDGQLWLVCRRCLSGLSFDLEARSRIHFVGSEAALPDLESEDPEEETLVFPESLNVAEWVAEEVLLALPLAPAHEEDACVSAEPVEEARAGKTRPFAVLGALKVPARE